MVTDYACWKEDGAHVTIEMVIEHVHRNAALAQQIITRALPEIPAEPGCSCHSALQNAILTDPRCWPATTKRQLALLLPQPRRA